MRRCAAVGVFLVALLGMPRTGHAGILELIWALSGPQMIGAGYSCLFRPPLERLGCRIGSSAATIKNDTPPPPRVGELLFVLGGVVFTSTSKDSDTQQYDWFDANMVAFEPGVVVFSRVPPVDGWRVSHGAGISYDLVFGDNFRRFDKFAFTVTPIQLTYKRLTFGIKLRIFPNGFTDDEFGFGPRLDFNRPAETTVGAGFSWIIW